MLRQLFVATLILIPLTSLAANKRTDCRPDTSNPIKGTCECDIVNALGDKTGIALFSCSDLACEEFEPGQVPQSCEPGMRGVTCEMYNTQYYLGCPLAAPRVKAEVEAEAFCKNATASLKNENNASPYYRFLSFSLCTPAGFSAPPADGWSFTGVYDEGWD